jgi:tRNA A37 threonylcarbamoyladenosine dehydratase
MNDERFARLERMVGAKDLARLHQSFIVVCGLGAVGSYATEALARAGIGRMRLIDADVVRPSNCNRQILALESTLGQAKARVAAARVADINPDCAVEPLELFIEQDTLDTVLAGQPDLVIDAIDSFGPKADLLTAVAARGLPVVASMGAALRTDPALVRCGPLSAVRGCPLANRVRQRLRSRGVDLEFPVIWSSEALTADRLGPPDPDGDSFNRGRARRVLGSLPTITAIFGLWAAHVAIARLLDRPLQGMWQ